MKVKPIYYLSGPDGAGKTTALSILKEHFVSHDKKVKTLYGLNKFLRYIGKRSAWLKHQATSGTDNISFRSFVAQGGGHMDRDTTKASWRQRKKLLLFLALLDVQFGFLFAFFYRLAGYVIIVETSPYDIFVKYHMPYFPVIEKLGAKIIPLPANYFILRAEPEAIYARKPELAVSEIAYYYSRLDKITGNVPASNIISITADLGIEQLKTDLLQHVSGI